MENQKPQIKTIAYNYGLYLALFSIATIVLMYALDLEKHWAIITISIIITVIIYVFGIIAYKKLNNNLLSLGEAIKLGLAIAAIAGVISALYSYIHYSYIQPEFIDALREEAVTKMVEQNPSLTNEQIEKVSEMTNMFTSPFFLSTMTLIGNLLLGIVISLIAGLIMKQEAHND